MDLTSEWKYVQKHTNRKCTLIRSFYNPFNMDFIMFCSPVTFSWSLESYPGLAWGLGLVNTHRFSIEI